MVYIEPIMAGGYPTTPQALVSQGEYWNVAEGSDPTTDTPCDATPILAEAGVTKQADITYNGYTKGVQFSPMPGVVIQQISKSGSRAIGIAGSTPVMWDEKTGYSLLPPGYFGPERDHGPQRQPRAGHRRQELAMASWSR